MTRRRSILATVGFLAGSATTGCLDTFSSGGLSNQIDRTQLTASKGEVVDHYDDALVERNDGVSALDRGIQSFNEAAYEEAIDRFETADGHLGEAVTGFSEAASLAIDIGEDEAVSICEAAEENTGLQIEATEAATAAASAAAGGGSAGDVNEHVADYQDSLDAANDVEVPTTQALADVLQSG